ncbi:Leucine-rich repeat-containing protein 1 [Fasciola hepatica]|uniref:Leucine-rich repeat-containing protein 1 n=1 Tax=Fasciola hepatica TaxID=6192 RepID=A0A4E0R5L4_FASHE|nr:Leucine-rich repeat-containing protein 1 [Fasciola hepatica]
MFACLPFVKPCGKQIDHIDRRHAKLDQVPDEVLRSFRTLEECRLDANQIKELPKNFFRLERIRYLTLSDNDLTRIPPGVGNFSQLVELDISRNDISELPPSIRLCDSLQIIDISNNPLQSLPAGFCLLRNLRILCMNDISITELPADFGNLHLLEKLEARDNCLKSVPDSFVQLVRLEFLDLGANEFHALPVILCQLPNLTELWMDDNQLKSIPKEVGSMKKLQQLDLSENLIDTLPEEVSGLVSLADLNLSQNSLNCLPTGIGEMKKLCVLKLNQNQLLILNPAIGGCVSLQELYLTENFLSALPPTISTLQSMFLLNMDQNQLTDLPPQIGDCTSLNILSLRENLLRRLPSEIGSCNRLRVLDVSGNRLQRLPLSLARCPLTALWLSPNQSQPVVTLQRDMDEVTNEEFLTCYLLPQDQLDSQTELDPTMSPSELASLTGVAPAVGPINLNDPDAIAVETNYAYEPAMPDVQSPTHPTSSWPAPIDAKCARPESLTSSTPSSMILSPPLSPSGAHPSVGERLGSPMGHQSNSFSPRASLTNQTGEWDSGSSRVHFNKQDETREKSSTKGFPKTRHPRFAKKPTDYQLNSRDDSSYSQSNDRNSFDESRTSLPRIPNETRPNIPIPTDLHGSFENPISGVQRGSGSATPITTAMVAPFTNPTTRDSWHPSDGSFAASPLTQHRSTPSPTGHSSPLPVGSADNTGNHIEPVLSTTPHVNLVVSTASLTAVDYSSVSPPKASSSRLASPEDASVPEMRVSPVRTPTGRNSGGSQHRLDVNSTADEDAYSSGGEEICVISRRVGFTDDVEDNEEKSTQKLIRRDTPHYTKRARIQSKTADGVDSEEAVLKILEKYRASAASNQLLADLPNSEVGGALKILATAAAAVSSPTTDFAKHRANRFQKLTVHIHRQPGAGLGLSIAGGVGSVPFQGADHGIFVSRLNPTGLAYTSGLRLNDKLLEVNGISLVDVEHQVAVSALRSQTNDFRILVARDSSVTCLDEHSTVTAPIQSSSSSVSVSGNPISSQSKTTLATDDLKLPHSDNTSLHIKCTLQRDGTGLGFSVIGGRGASSSSDHERVMISKITEGGAASKSGNLFVGDQIIKINGIDVQDARHDQVIALLAGAGAVVNLEVLRPILSAGDISRTKPTFVPLQSAGTSADKPTKESWLGQTSGNHTTPSAVTVNSAPRVTPNHPVYLRQEKGLAVENVTICLDGGPLGLAIYGGSDINCQPFSSDEPGIFISRISNDGAAQNCGLRVGDRILRVNDIDLRNATHDEAVEALIQPVTELHLEVRRDPTPRGLRRLTITRQPGERFGLRISGGVPVAPQDSTGASNGSLSRCLSSLSNDGSILVTWVSSDGAVGRDGRLKPGDRLLEVNGNWMMGSTLDEALSIFRRADDVLHLIVCDGPLDPMNLHMPGSLLKAEDVNSQTVSSPLPFSEACSTPTGFSVDLLEDGLMDSRSSNPFHCGDGLMSTTLSEAHFSVKTCIPQTESVTRLSPSSSTTETSSSTCTSPTMLVNIPLKTTEASPGSDSLDSNETSPTGGSLVLASPAFVHNHGRSSIVLI